MHLLILLGKLLLKEGRLCKLVKKAPLGSRATFNIGTLFAGEIAFFAEVEGSKVPCCIVKVFKPSAHKSTLLKARYGEMLLRVFGTNVLT